MSDRLRVDVAALTAAVLARLRGDAAVTALLGAGAASVIEADELAAALTTGAALPLIAVRERAITTDGANLATYELYIYDELQRQQTRIRALVRPIGLAFDLEASPLAPAGYALVESDGAFTDSTYNRAARMVRVRLVC